MRTNQLFTESANVRRVLKVKRLKTKNTVFNDIPIHQKLKIKLIAYHEDLESSEWLFPSEASSTGHLTRAQAHNILTAAFETLGLEGASTHSMRRTCLTNMSRAGVPLRTIHTVLTETVDAIVDTQERLITRYQNKAREKKEALLRSAEQARTEAIEAFEDTVVVNFG